MAGTDGLYIYIVQRGDTLAKIVTRNFQVYSRSEVSQKVFEVARLSYVKDVHRLRVGQLLVLGDALQRLPMSRAAKPIVEKDDLIQIQANVNSLTPQEKKVLGTHWDILQGLDDVRRSVSDFPTTMSTVGEKYGVGTANDFAGGAIDGTGSVSEEVFKRPNESATKLVGTQFEKYVGRAGQAARRVRERAITAVRRGPIPKPSSFVVRVSPTIVSSRAMVDQMNRMSKILKGTRWLGRASTFLNVVLSTCAVVDAPSGQKARTATVEGFGMAGGMILGGGAAYVACNLVFGLPTAGTSMLWCGLVVGSAFGAIGAYGGKKLGGAAYGASKSAYDKLDDMFSEAKHYNYLSLPPVAW